MKDYSYAQRVVILLAHDIFKAKVIQVVSERQLASIMNNTKWEELQTAVLNTLPFPPPYQAKYVLEDVPYPNEFEDDVWYMGDWIEGLMPFFHIEWIRVRARRVVKKGMLIQPEVTDITEEFIRILKDYSIPYYRDNQSIYIYGYISGTDKLITGDE